MKITILGAGKSGISAALLAKRVGDEPFLSEYKLLGSILELDENEISYESGGHSDEIYNCELVILSPGIDRNLPLIQLFISKNIPVISEIEYAFRNSSQTCIGITGSNGKTTTTTLLGKMLESEFGGKRIAGNIGIPFADIASKSDKMPIVLELSSFQLESMDTYKSKTSILLNVSPNHLDRYDSYDAYIDAKLLLLNNSDENSELIVNADDDIFYKRTSDFIGKRYLFSLHRKDTNAFIENNAIWINLNSKIKLCDFSELKLSGPHHIMNMMAASLAALLNNVKIETIRKVIRSFNGLEHRMEFVREFGGLTFINDSKSTSVEALKMALQSYKKPIILLAGGKHKGASYSYLGEFIKNYTRKVFVFGEAKNIMFEDWNEFGSIEKVETMDEAIQKSLEIGEKGDITLLSPACSSFDQFSSYEDRGQQFKTYVNNL